LEGNPSLKFEKGSEPLVIYAGLVISQQQLNQINPKDIESIDVVKGEKAIAAYGEKGKNGVIKITPKAQSYTQSTTTGQIQQEVVVSGFTPKAQTESASKKAIRVKGFPLENPPLFVIDGKIVTSAEMDAINPDNIARVNVLKDQKATEAYGDKGKNGVVEIELKKEPIKL
jgi:outer membrane receptor protein involved in Fe transport